MKCTPCISRFPAWGLMVFTILTLAWSAGGQTLPPQQTAILWDDGHTTDPEFFLGTGGTYKLQFIENQDGVYDEYLVEFLDTGTGTYIASEQFWQTTQACFGARTVTLQGGIYYRMHIGYAVGGGGGNPEPGVICQARIFYTCTPK
ncbi:MAG: hypothetical protein PHI18_08170 [bacterium]|nr:hypothetical protein [bacterium]